MSKLGIIWQVLFKGYHELQSGLNLFLVSGVGHTKSATTFFDSVMKEADDALYEAKRQGKNRYFWHHQMHTQPADDDQQVTAVTH